MNDDSDAAEEVIRVLAPVDPADPDSDAWTVVTLTRPHGSDDSVEWKPFAAYGPMTFELANQFLADLGAQAVGVAQRSDFPVVTTVSSEIGMADPRTRDSSA